VARLPRHTLRVIVVGLTLAIVLAFIVVSSSVSRSPSKPTPVTASAFRDFSYEDLVEPTRTAETYVYDYMVTPTASPSPKPTAKPKPKVRAVVKPKAKPVIRSRSKVSGVATWYCLPGKSRCTRGFSSGGAYGAAGPELRKALGNWRGKTVYVNGVRVKLIDWCACGGNHVIDVYHSTWVKIPHPNSVTIRW
jgi:hypothetical protein